MIHNTIDSQRERIIGNTWMKSRLIFFGFLSCSCLVAGCGCYYGDVSEVTVTPEIECLDVHAKSACSELEISGTNYCEETLVFSSDTEILEVGPEESFNFAPGAFGTVIKNDCDGYVEIPATLGETEIVFEFTFERINRGVGKCQ